MLKIIRLYHTVKYLKWEQVAFRLKVKFFPLKKLPDLPQSEAQEWCWSGPEVLEPSILASDSVRFLNCNGKVISAEDWNNPSFDKLWLYNLHYFDDLNAKDSFGRKELQLSFVKKWIADNPPVSGNGWEPYPISLRLVNWIKWYNRVGINDDVILESIQLQAEALTKQLEYHILGNHLFANSKALIFSGCFLMSPASDKYLELGLMIMKKELKEQFLIDGGHFERSPMYHCILLWDVLDLINLSVLCSNPLLKKSEPELRLRAKKSLQWLHVMIHPDFEISFFNDCAIGIAAKPVALFAYAVSLGIECSKLSDSGIHTLENSGYSRINMERHVCFFDHAPVGPGYLPGHGHADTLSIEWSVGSQRVLVNSGTSVYGVSDERLRQRRTAAHNTVEVDGKDSSEVWSGFRVARRATAFLEKINSGDASVEVLASHDGYTRLKGNVLHRRSVKANALQLKIHDTLTGRFEIAVAYFHLHPNIEVVQQNGEVLLLLPDGQSVSVVSSGVINVQPSSWHPEFGVTVSSKRLSIAFHSPSVSTTFSLI